MVQAETDDLIPTPSFIDANVRIVHQDAIVLMKNGQFETYRNYNRRREPGGAVGGRPALLVLNPDELNPTSIKNLIEDGFYEFESTPNRVNAVNTPTSRTVDLSAPWSSMDARAYKHALKAVCDIDRPDKQKTGLKAFAARAREFYETHLGEDDIREMLNECCKRYDFGSHIVKRAEKLDEAAQHYAQETGEPVSSYYNKLAERLANALGEELDVDFDDDDEIKAKTLAHSYMTRAEELYEQFKENKTDTVFAPENRQAMEDRVKRAYDMLPEDYKIIMRCAGLEIGVGENALQLLHLDSIDEHRTSTASPIYRNILVTNSVDDIFLPTFFEEVCHSVDGVLHYSGYDDQDPTVWTAGVMVEMDENIQGLQELTQHFRDILYLEPKNPIFPDTAETADDVIDSYSSADMKAAELLSEMMIMEHLNDRFHFFPEEMSADEFFKQYVSEELVEDYHAFSRQVHETAQDMLQAKPEFATCARKGETWQDSVQRPSGAFTSK